MKSNQKSLVKVLTCPKTSMLCGTMNTLLGLYMAPDGFHVLDSRGGMTFNVDDDYVRSGRIETIMEDKYLVVKELIGQPISDEYQITRATATIEVAGEIYYIYFDDNQQKRILKRKSNGEILATGPREWSHDQIQAQKHGTLIIFTVQSSLGVMFSLSHGIFMYPGRYIPSSTNDIDSHITEYDVYVEKDKSHDFIKVLSKRGIPILKQKLVQAKFEKLL